MNLTISDYKTGDEQAILDLFEKVFKKPMSIKYWYWRFRDNPSGSHKIKLMWDNNILVGHYAVSPVKMMIDGVEEIAALSMTTMTHPSYGGKGIFGILASALYKDLEKEGVKMVWGFPNNNSHYGFIKNLAWKDVGIVLPLVLDYKLNTENPNYYISIGNDFTSEHADILNSICNNAKIYSLRNAEYLNWRLKLNPENNYILIEYRQENGILEAFIVFKKFSNDKESKSEIDLIEIGCLNPSAVLPQLLDEACKYYQFQEATINSWININDKRFIQFEKLGFKLNGNPTYLGFKTLNGKDLGIENLNNWYYSYSDSDVY